MFTGKYFRGIAVSVMFIFVCFAFTQDVSYSQEENPLLKAQGLFKQGYFIEAVKVLEEFIGNVKDKPSEKKRLAEANLLMARIYYEAGEDSRVLEYMQQAVEAYSDIGKEEGNLDFKSRLEQVRDKWVMKQKGKDETAALEKKTEKTETVQPVVQEREKTTPQMKKKRKFPWLLAIAGVGLAVVLVVLLSKKKKQTLTVTVGEGATGNPGAGSYQYKKGDSATYSYSVISNNYEKLQVRLDGIEVSATGTIVMNQNHVLDVTAVKITTQAFSENFEASASGSKPNGWNIAYSGRDIYVTDSTSYDGSKSVFIQGQPFWGAQIQRMLTSYNFSPGTTSIIFYMKVDTNKWLGNDGTSLCQVYLNQRCVGFGVTKTNGVFKIYYLDSNGTDKTLAIPNNVNIGNWVQYKVIFNTSTGSVQYYLSNSLLLTTDSYTGSSADQVLLTSGAAGDGNGYPAAYFDSISIVK